MTRARIGACGSVAKIAVAGVLVGLPIAAVSVPAYAAPAGTPSVLPAPPPADPPAPAPPPPPPPPPPVQSNHSYDWWGYGDPGGGGGGG